VPFVAPAPPGQAMLFPRHLETDHPADIIRWAVDTYGLDRVVLTTSFSDAVLSHLAATAAPGLEIVLLDTQYLFAETEWYADQLVRRFDLHLRVVHPDPSVDRDDLWQTDPDACCRARKVEPLDRALEGKSAWITGVRRADSPSRAGARVASLDANRNIVKINPIVNWSDDEVELYQDLFDLPRHPLTDRGYPSIGCWPCTTPVREGDDPRAGRWAGKAKTECGLHP
jgi:phosphoadenosine phosphosulfate reductase